MRTPTLRTAALAAALPLALWSLAACGDSSSQTSATDPQAAPAASSSPTTTSSPGTPKTVDSADFLARLKAANAAITTARFSMTMDLSGQTVPIKGVLDMTGNSPAMQMTMDITGMGTPTEMRLVDKTMYVALPGGGGKFYKIDLDDPDGPLAGLGGDAFSNIDPGSVTDQLSPKVFKKVVDRGTVTIGGQELHHYSVLMDLSKAPRLEGMPSGAAAPKVATYDVWLDGEGRMARFTMLIKKSMRLTATYSGYGTAAHVAAPPSSQVMALPSTSADG
jgi:hypothetical protein